LPAWTDTEDHVVALDLFHVTPLVALRGRTGFCRSAGLAGRQDQDAFESGIGIRGGDSQQILHRAIVHAFLADQIVILAQNTHRAVHLRGFAFNRKLRIAKVRSNA
jgi:hypothetical protein